MVQSLIVRRQLTWLAASLLVSLSALGCGNNTTREVASAKSESNAPSKPLVESPSKEESSESDEPSEATEVRRESRSNKGEVAVSAKPKRRDREADVQKKFSEIEIDDAFRPYLVSNVLLMEVTGAKLIRLPKKRTAVISIASTVLKDDSANERLRAEKVCRLKAFANIVAEKEGVQVAHAEELKEQTKIVIDENGESGHSISELMQVTKTQVTGIAKDMPVVGRWNSKNGEVFYMALGVILDKNGEPIELDE